MATILVMSDTGSVSLVATHTDWPDEMACRQILASHYQPPPVSSFNGHNVTAKISASCVPVGSVPVGALPQVNIPPPLANLIPRFVDPRHLDPNGVPMLAPPCGGRLPCEYN